MSKQITDNQCDKKYKYDAFISYRHVELDKYIAEKIHQYLEEFKLPKNIKNRMGLKKTRIERVFRDKDELTITNNLEEPIIQALRESEYLIVICSRHTKESVWCRKEIEKFMEFHGRGKILTVLIEGELEESFPEELLYEEEMVKKNGVYSVHCKTIEPLAADIRAKSKRQMCALLETELLRIIAPIFGLEYNDLRQRHKERRIRRILTATVSAAVLGLAIGIAGVTSALIISDQKDKIEEQKDEITEQKELIELKNEKLLYPQAENLTQMSLDYLAQDRRIDAINMALSSITQFEGMRMPYTSDGRYALTKALRVYDIGYVNKAQKQFEADSNIISTLLSTSRKYLLACDKFKDAYIWDVVTGQFITKISDLNLEDSISFVGDTIIVYHDDYGKIHVYDFINYNNVFVVQNDEYGSLVKGDQMGKYIAFVARDRIDIYDATNGKIIFRINGEKGKIFGEDLVWCGDKLIYMELKYNLDDGIEKTTSTIKISDVKSRNTIEVVGNFNGIDGAKLENGYIFISSNCFEGTEELGTILAIEESNGLIIWENEYKGMPIRKMEVIEREGEPLVVATSFDKLFCIDGNTGTEYYNESVLEGIADFVISTDGHAQVINHDGKLIGFNVFEQELYSMDYYLECNVKKIDNLGICEGGYYVLPMASNYIIKYEAVYNEDMEIYQLSDEIRESMEELWAHPRDCTEEAKKIGVTNPELVANILYINSNIAMVTYLDLTMDIYDTTHEKVINSIGDVQSVPVRCYGTDYEGNTYVAGDRCGYCFDKEYNLIAEIDAMKYADVDKGYIIVGEIVGDLWKIPMYSCDDLIEKAKDVLASH